MRLRGGMKSTKISLFLDRLGNLVLVHFSHAHTTWLFEIKGLVIIDCIQVASKNDGNISRADCIVTTH